MIERERMCEGSELKKKRREGKRKGIGCDMGYRAWRGHDGKHPARCTFIATAIFIGER